MKNIFQRIVGFVSGKGAKAHEEPICGGVTDYSNPKAPKTIVSKEIVSFSTGFFIYDPDEDRSTGMWNVDISRDEQGGITLRVKGVYNHTLAVGEDILSAIQRVIDKHGLVKNNGGGRVTAGLPPQFSPWVLDVKYASGERLYFYEDGDPESRWTYDLKKIFEKELANAGLI